jgi:anti-sigma factor RsiW
MTHPEELLAGYVDGTLSPRDRADVETHLAGCSRCSREVALAGGARTALRSLPEVPAPEGVAAKAIEEATGARIAAGGTPRWYRFAGVAAAVAAGLLVFTLVLPHIGNGARSTSDASRAKDQGAAGGAREVTAMAPATAIEIRHVNFDDASLTALTSSYRSPSPGASGAGTAAALITAFGSQAQTNKALACIVKSAPNQKGDLQALIRARFKGTPAYLAVFTEGPGAGQPADTVTVWVFGTTDCGILSFSSAQL